MWCVIAARLCGALLQQRVLVVGAAGVGAEREVGVQHVLGYVDEVGAGLGAGYDYGDGDLGVVVGRVADEDTVVGPALTALGGAGLGGHADALAVV